MNNLSPFPETGGSAPSYPTRRNTSQRGGAGIIQLWYRITSPPEPDATAPFQERELFRRGRTGSQISIILFILIFISYPAAFAGSNSLLIGILSVNLLILCLALALNRSKMVNVAGVLVVISNLASPMMNILTTPGGINTSALPIFSLLVLPLMCAVSFLPPGWIFVVAGANALFALYSLSFVPSTGELHQVLQTSFPGIVTPILLSQFIVSIVAYIWVRGARQAILRADRAEEIAALERREIEQQQREIEQKQQLDLGIQQILQTHVMVANGNFTVRAPLGKENILWQIAYSLNNLLARLQSYGQMANHYQQLQEENFRLQNAIQSNTTAYRELQRTKEAATHLVDLLKQSRDGHVPPLAIKSGTIIDAVATQLSDAVDTKPTSEQRQSMPQRSREHYSPPQVRNMGMGS